MDKKPSFSTQSGASIIELLVVLLILCIVTLSVLIGTSSSRLYAADTQALAIMDILQEARQRAVNQSKTIRVELNDTKKQIRLIDENSTNGGADDKVLTTSKFNPLITVGVKPANVYMVGVVPTASTPIPEIQYTTTTYPLSANDKVKTLRFLKTGEVVDAGTDGLGTGALSSGVTIYVYNGASGSKSNVVRAITVSGITADTQLLKCQMNSQGTCISWKK